MLSLSEGFLFVWEPADLLMPWHVFLLPKWSGGGCRKILVKSLVVGQKILIIKRSCIMEWVKILKGLQGVSGENRKLHNCSIIN